jgi:tRNA modification GTPase
MHAPHALDDTIVAIATAPGPAGLAVVRVSGVRALAIAAAVFRGADLAEAPSHTLHHGWAVRPRHAARSTGAGEPHGAANGSERLDEVVAAVFRAPRSYTRENVVEFSCHGGRLAAAGVLEALLAVGARLASPGEFTLRAFLHGRVDLVQAEAVADLIHAETDAARALAIGQLAGELSRRLAAVREAVADLLAEVEARVDFAEDVGGIEIPPRAAAGIAECHAALAQLLDGAAFARAVREGVRVPLAGRPNVGKSSLFNALVGESRAIVTPEPGTTRDRVSESIEIAGVRVLLSDTAGLREGAGSIEVEGIARAREAMESSALAIWVVDASRPLDDEDRAVARLLSASDRRVVVALNKSDLDARVSAADVARALGRADASGADGREFAAVAVSARSGAGIDALRESLASALGADREGGRSALANPRHVESLARARAALERASAAAAEHAPGEILALELRESLAAIGEVTGQTVADDLLERIFSRFCVGK